MLKSSVRLLVAAFLLGQLLACQTLAPEAVDDSAAVTAGDDVKPAEEDPAQSLYELALWSAQNDKTADAISQFEQVIMLNPSFKRAYTNLGLLQLQQGELEQAKKSFENAINQDKSDAIAYTHLAVIQRQQGEFAQAQQNYKKAIEIDANYAKAHLNYGILLDIYLQDLDQALRQYETYQQLLDQPDETVDKWIVDLKRRIESN